MTDETDDPTKPLIALYKLITQRQLLTVLETLAEHAKSQGRDASGNSKDWPSESEGGTAIAATAHTMLHLAAAQHAAAFQGAVPSPEELVRMVMETVPWVKTARMVVRSHPGPRPAGGWPVT